MESATARTALTRSRLARRHRARPWDASISADLRSPAVSAIARLEERSRATIEHALTSMSASNGVTAISSVPTQTALSLAHAHLVTR
jgi:hypothetical protein